MKTTAVAPADLERCVIAVPPLARRADYSFDAGGNTAIIRHVEAAGVRTLLYGGNANFYNVGLREYPAILDALAAQAASDTWIIPSAGPDFGRLMDQVSVLRERSFPTVMVLPASFAMTVDGEPAILFKNVFPRTASGKAELASDYLGEKYGAPDYRKRTFFRAVVDGQYKLVRWFSPNDYGNPSTLDELYATGDVTLHNLVNDPGELENIGNPAHPKHDPALVERMLTKLHALVEHELGEDHAPFDLDIFGTREVKYGKAGEVGAASAG